MVLVKLRYHLRFSFPLIVLDFCQYRWIIMFYMALHQALRNIVVPLFRVDQDMQCLSQLFEHECERTPPDVVSEIRWDGTTFAHLSPLALKGLLKSQWSVSIPVRLEFKRSLAVPSGLE